MNSELAIGNEFRRGQHRLESPTTTTVERGWILTVLIAYASAALTCHCVDGVIRTEGILLAPETSGEAA